MGKHNRFALAFRRVFIEDDISETVGRRQLGELQFCSPYVVSEQKQQTVGSQRSKDKPFFSHQRIPHDLLCFMVDRTGMVAEICTGGK
jgi:hypothetical protein